MKTLLASLMAVVLMLAIACQNQDKNQTSRFDQAAIDLQMAAMEDAGLLEGDTAKMQKALRKLDEALAIEPQYDYALYSQMQLYMALQHYDSATVAAAKLVEIAPNDPLRRGVMGVLFDVQGDSVAAYKQYVLAAQHFEKVLDTLTLNQDSIGSTRLLYAQMLKLMGQEEEANQIIGKLAFEQKQDRRREYILQYAQFSRRELLQTFLQQ